MSQSLEAVELEKSFQKKKVVDHVSLRVNRGEIVGLLGPNGAGKTTTFSLVLGHIPQDSGKIFLNGEEISKLPMYIRARRGLSLLAQEPSIYRKLSVEENLLAVKETMRNVIEKGENGLEKILYEFGLDKLAKAKAYTLSGGERRRLEIARALIMNPDYILMDEPFTGIDPLAIHDIQEIILSLKKRGLGLLITDHSVRETLKITDRTYIIENGRILKEGVSDDLVKSEIVRRKYLGVDFNLD